MIEFTKEELEIIATVLFEKDEHIDLAMIVASEVDRLNDLENMDFDDCAGGACKL